MYNIKRIKIFISSVQSEFADERLMLSRYIRTDVLLGKFFDPFIFEELPANKHAVQEVYLKEVELCDIYLGLFGNQYGYEDNSGISPTEREYDLASTLHKDRLIYIKNASEARHQKEELLIRKIERDVVRKTFEDIDNLRTSVYASLIRYLEEKEYIRFSPFDASVDNGATMEELDEDKMKRFISIARKKRGNTLAENTPPEIFAELGIKSQSKSNKAYFYPLIEMGIVEYVIKDKLKSKNQKYKLSSLGLELLKKIDIPSTTQQSINKNIK